MHSDIHRLTGASMRQQLLVEIHAHTRAMLSAARSKRGEEEMERRRHAARDAEIRRLFVSELRSAVHALRARFALARRGTLIDLQHPAVEMSPAPEAVRAKPVRTAKPRRRASKSAAKPAGEKRQRTPPRKRH